MKMQLGPEIIASYKRLAYHVWYALAEFVDNSTQAYFNNRDTLDEIYKKENNQLTVSISTGADAVGEFIRIEDNSIGMSEEELMNAVHIGKPPIDPRGRARYGLGLKTGASWFGDLWSIESKKLNDLFRHKVTVDVPKVASGNLNLPHDKNKANLDEHYTIIEIRHLHRRITGRILTQVKNYLSSLYRRDISNNNLILKINSDIMKWDSDLEKLCLIRADGSRASKRFKFWVHKRLVTGWAGVLEKGSRKNAGFSILQSNRVITGWPSTYRPETVFGEHVGGVNDLVNQRLFGELVMDDFEVSHTKDQILYDEGEQELLEQKLYEKIKDLRQLALSHRKDADERVKLITDDQRDAALNAINLELQSDKIQSVYRTIELPSSSLIRKTNDAVKSAVVSRIEPSLKSKIGSTTVLIYLAKDMSPNDPYVIIESTRAKSSVIVIINLSHPHWSQLTNDESVLNFIRHCTYDGVAESKAYAVTGQLEPDTIKMIKDNLLRFPLSLQNRTKTNPATIGRRK